MPKIRMISKDHTQLLELEKKVLPLDQTYSTINPKAFWWGYFHQGKLVAASALSIWIPGWGFLARTLVHPDFRGLGLQKRFIRAREKFARCKGVHTLVTYTDPKNIISANNLIKCGFQLYIPTEKWGIQPFCYYFKKNIKKNQK